MLPLAKDPSRRDAASWYVTPFFLLWQLLTLPRQLVQSCGGSETQHQSLQVFLDSNPSSAQETVEQSVHWLMRNLPISSVQPEQSQTALLVLQWVSKRLQAERSLERDPMAAFRSCSMEAQEIAREVLGLQDDGPVTMPRSKTNVMGQVDLMTSILREALELEDAKEAEVIFAVEAESPLAKGVSWDFFPYLKSADRSSDRSSLAPLAFSHMQQPAAVCGCDLELAKVFFMSLEARYRDVPYHNAFHAADVVNSMTYFLQLTSKMAAWTPGEQVMAVTAAAAHDAGHDGRTGRFHILTESSLAQLYNDQSCLENLHCAITFALLRTVGTDFMKTVETHTWRSFRSGVIQMILGTDLSKHLEAVTNFKKEFLTDSWAGLEDKHRVQLLSFLLKAADVGGAAKPFRLHAAWSMKVLTEFYAEGDAERALGIPPSHLYDRHTDNVAKSQSGFFTFVVEPLFNSLGSFLNSPRFKLEVLDEVERNKNFWSKYTAEDFTSDEPEANVRHLIRLFMNETTALQFPILSMSIQDGAASPRVEQTARTPHSGEGPDHKANHFHMSSSEPKPSKNAVAKPKPV